MKVLLIIITLGFVVANASPLTTQWTSFKEKHEKSYESALEENLRFEIFQSNLEKIQKHNAKYDKGESSYYLSINKFADMTGEEFENKLLKQLESKPEITGIPFSITNAKAPSSIDWRGTGAVSEVKNQGTCGSCWSFSATGALEAQNFLINGVRSVLSEQELMDCTYLYGNEGCNGGYPKGAFEYVRAHGISTEESYPYEGENHGCRRNGSNIVLTIQDYNISKHGTVENLKNSIASAGPVSVIVEADRALQLYGGGIFDEESCTNFLTNHAVLAVGYDSENGKEYWILKNSWGTEWGEDGYYRLQLDPVICAILTEVTYPVL